MPLTNEYEVIRFFNDAIDVWGMDVFHLNDITNGHPLVTTACAIFRVSSPNTYLLRVHPITEGCVYNNVHKNSGCSLCCRYIFHRVSWVVSNLWYMRGIVYCYHLGAKSMTMFLIIKASHFLQKIGRVSMFSLYNNLFLNN